MDKHSQNLGIEVVDVDYADPSDGAAYVATLQLKPESIATVEEIRQTLDSHIEAPTYAVLILGVSNLKGATQMEALFKVGNEAEQETDGLTLGDPNPVSAQEFTEIDTEPKGGANVSKAELTFEVPWECWAVDDDGVTVRAEVHVGGPFEATSETLAEVIKNNDILDAGYDVKGLKVVDVRVKRIMHIKFLSLPRMPSAKRALLSSICEGHILPHNITPRLREALGPEAVAAAVAFYEAWRTDNKAAGPDFDAVKELTHQCYPEGDTE